MITKRDAKKAIAEYYKREYGITLTRGSGVEIDSVEDGVITYHTAVATKRLQVEIRSEYVFNPLSELSPLAGTETPKN